MTNTFLCVSLGMCQSYTGVDSPVARASVDSPAPHHHLPVPCKPRADTVADLKRLESWRTNTQMIGRTSALK